MVSKDESRESNTTKSTKTLKAAKISTGGHRDVAQRIAKLYEDREKVIYEECLGEASCTGEGVCHNDNKDSREKIITPTEIASNGAPLSDMRDKAVHAESSLMGHGDPQAQWASGQAWSGQEDDITEEPDLTSMDKSSSLSFLDWQNRDDSDVQTTLAIEVDVKTEVVLIDEDDDMSLREKTVTDVSMMDGNAAELVCGRLMSMSTDSSSECKAESLAAETPQPPSDDIKKRRCCFCTII